MLWPALGEVLPVGVAIAVSPLAIVAVVVLLLGEGGRLRGALFASGWTVTILAVTTVAFSVVDATADVGGERRRGPMALAVTG